MWLKKKLKLSLIVSLFYNNRINIYNFVQKLIQPIFESLVEIMCAENHNASCSVKSFVLIVTGNYKKKNLDSDIYL